MGDTKPTWEYDMMLTLEGHRKVMFGFFTHCFYLMYNISFQSQIMFFFNKHKGSILRGLSLWSNVKLFDSFLLFCFT